MLGLGDKAAAKSEHIIDGTDASFMKDVVEASKTVPVIVDFWATWCGPCRTLGPAIEAAVAKAGGKVKLVKIDVDANPGYAGQLRVQSIPTVYAFWQGQPVDGFQGALPPSELDKFIAKQVELGGGAGAEAEDLTAAIEAAEQMLAEGAIQDATETFVAILQEEPTNIRAYAGFVSCFLAMGDVEQAEAALNGAPAEIASAPELESLRAKIALTHAAAKAGPVTELEARLFENPTDHQARLDLAVALLAEGRAQDAVDQCLELFRRDREWNDGAAKTQLFKIFDSLKATDPIVLNGRRKLSSMIFA